MNGAEQPRVYISGTLPALLPPNPNPPPPPAPVPRMKLRALRGDGTRNGRRFGRTLRGASRGEMLSGPRGGGGRRSRGRHVELSGDGDGDVRASSAPRLPALPVPSSSPREKRDGCQRERAERIGAAIKERHSPNGAPADDTAARLCRTSLPRSGSH